MPAPPLNLLLKMAVVAGVETAVRLHIRRGDDLDARDGGGLTPLMLAASRNKANICRLLLASGVNPDLADPSGRNALAIAHATGASDAAAVIIEDATARQAQQLATNESVVETQPSRVDTLATPIPIIDTIEPQDAARESSTEEPEVGLSDRTGNPSFQNIATGNDGGCLEKIEIS